MIPRWFAHHHGVWYPLSQYIVVRLAFFKKLLADSCLLKAFGMVYLE
jgi:hypothetical protein